MTKPRVKAVLCALCTGAATYVALAAGQEMSPLLKNYKPVTAQRLLKPDDGDWLMIRRTYDGWGYSPLEKINTSTVATLKPVWMVDTGESRVHEAAPIVNSGVMFVTTPNNQVIALDAKTGAILWRYKRPRIAGALVPHDTNRGVALYGHNVWLHLGTAAIAVYFGWRARIPVLSEPYDDERERRSGLADRRETLGTVPRERRQGAYDRRMPLGT